MNVGTENRPLLPQHQHTMQNFSFAPPNLGVTAGEKSVYPLKYTYTFRQRWLIDIDYVFVDEHNRHKRLKGRPHFLEPIYISLTCSVQ